MDLGLVEVPYNRVNQSIVNFLPNGIVLGTPGLIQKYLKLPNGTTEFPKVSSGFILGHNDKIAYVITLFGGVRFLTDLSINDPNT